MSQNADASGPKELFGGKPHRFKGGPEWKGNRFGRPKKPAAPPPPPPPPDPKELAREKSARAIEILGQLMEDPSVSASNRITAANAILDRGYGKPQQVIEATLTPFEKMDTNELIEFIAAQMIDVTDYTTVDVEPEGDDPGGDEGDFLDLEANEGE